MNINHKTNLIVIIYGIILILGIFVAFQGSNYAFMNGDDVARIEGDDFLMSLNRRIMLFGDSEKQTFVATLDKEEFPEIEGEDYSLIIFRLASNGYKVYFNDRFIGGFGQYETGNSNLWNGIKRFNIPKEWLTDENQLRLENHSKYMTGLTTHPMFLTSVDKATMMVALSQLYNHNAVMASLGISFLAIIILLVLYWSSRQRGKMYVSLALAMFFLGIYSIDYGTAENVFMNYMIYKKIIMISFWASTFFVGLGLKQIFGNTISETVGLVGLIGIFIMALFSTDLIMFKTLYSYWYISQILNVLTWLYVVFKNINESIEARVFFSGFGILFIYSGINYWLDLSGEFFSMNSSLIYTSVFSIMPLLLVYLDFTKNRQELRTATLQKEEAYRKAITDSLTGAYNKHHLTTVMNEIELPYSIVMFDIDNFKEVNDEYGHQGGDEVLRHLLVLLKHFLREEDKCFRYGGDEFVIIMKCPIHVVGQRMEDFRKKVAQTSITYGVLDIKTSLSIGLYSVEEKLEFHEVLDAVDKALYHSKRFGKNRVSLYHPELLSEVENEI